MISAEHSKCAVVFDKRDLELLIKKHPPIKGKKNYYVNFSNDSFENINILDEFSFAQYSINTIDKKLFIKEYIKLIGQIGIDHNSRKWWASDISSKNPFSSRLSLNIEQYIRILDALEYSSYNYLIIIDPDLHLLDVLIKTFQDKPKNLIYFKNRINIHFKTIINNSRKIYLNFRDAMGISIKIFFAKKELKHYLKKELNSRLPYYLIKSFIFKGSFNADGTYKDIFFGSLPNHLKSNKNILIVVNILEDYRKNLKNIKNQSGFLILPIESFLTYYDVIKCFYELLFHNIEIDKKINFLSYEITDVINSSIKNSCPTISFHQYLHYNYIENISKLIIIDQYLHTYENNPWEKMSIMAIRKFSSKTSIVGYQHSIVAEAFVSSFISKNEKDIMPLPDKIFTVGEITKNILEEYGEYDINHIESSCSLRYEYFNDITSEVTKKSGNILLVLDGVEEAYQLVNYTVGELKNNPNYNLTIKPHPAFPLYKFIKHIKYDLDMISNIKVSSNNSVPKDLSNADIVIYWGSTIALEALNMGIPVIHHDNCNKSFLSYDPLFDFNHLKWSINSNDSLIDTIEQILSLKDEEYIIARDKVKKYIKRYFYPVNKVGLDKFANHYNI